MTKMKALTLDDYGLTDPAILEEATRMAPELFMALALARGLDASHYPLTSDIAIERALQSVANDGDQFVLGGARVTSKAAKDRFPNEFLPVVDRFDLLRKAYIAVIISHRESSRRAWEKVQSGSEVLKASHPVPTEVL